MSKDDFIPDSVKGTGYFTPMDIAPGEFVASDQQEIRENIEALLAKYFRAYKPYDGETEQTIDAILQLLESAITEAKREMDEALPERNDPETMKKLAARFDYTSDQADGSLMRTERDIYFMKLGFDEALGDVLKALTKLTNEIAEEKSGDSGRDGAV